MDRISSSHQAALFLLLAATLKLTTAKYSHSDISNWSDEFSEEGDGGNQPQPDNRYYNHPLVGMKCSGRYCDNVSVKNCMSGISDMNSQKNVDLIGRDAGCYWSPPTYSESADNKSAENNNIAQCDKGYFASSMWCNGGGSTPPGGVDHSTKHTRSFRFCNVLNLRCCPTDSSVWVVGDSTYTSESFSEEDPPAMCPTDMVMTALECSGSYCDNHRISCAPFTFPIKGAKPVAKWTMFCTGAVTSICAKHVDEQVISTFSTQDSSSWQTSMQVSFELGFEFLGVGGKENFAIGSSWGHAITKTFSETHSTSRGCDVQVTVDPKCVTNSTYNLVVWQFESSTGFEGFLDGKTSTVDSCFTYVTSSAAMAPLCLPGLCNDCDCQTCRTREEAALEEAAAQKTKGLVDLLK